MLEFQVLDLYMEFPAAIPSMPSFKLAPFETAATTKWLLKQIISIRQFGHGHPGNRRNGTIQVVVLKRMVSLSLFDFSF